MEHTRTRTQTFMQPGEEWAWNETSPFYQGENWQNYLSNGGLIREMITSGFGSGISQLQSFLLDQPDNGLLVYGDITATAQIPNSFFVASNRDLPVGWYTKNSTFRIVVPNYDEGTLTRYSFVLKSQAEVLAENYNQRIVDAGVQFIDFLEGLIPLGVTNLINFDELGVWQLVATETTALEPIKPGGRSTSDIVEESVKAAKTDFLGLLVSGVGIFTGNPLLIGGGLVLSFIQGRQND